MYVERTFTVARPVEAVFDYLADFEHTNEWDPGTIDTERIQGDGGVGTTYSNISEFLGRQVELTYETVEHERPTTLVFRGNQGHTWTTDTLRLTAVGEETSIHYRADFVFGTAAAIYMSMFGKKKLEQLADDTVAQMQDALAQV
jgi:carbon monoxide dehydrogenase subunit G